MLGIVGARRRRVPKRSAGREVKVVTELKPKKNLTNTRIKIICTAGSGLGLSIAQAIAILHGGKIEVRNATNGRGEACVCFAAEIYGV